jgi:spore germination protein GerM
MADTSRVFWVAADDTVVPRGREVNGTTRRERLTSLLEQLAAQPTRAERAEQLSTALPPEIGLTVTELDGGTASIDLEVEAQALSGVSGRRAVAQIVLTATSVPGVDAVLLELAGEPIEAPLPAGALTARPLSAADYAAVATPTPPAAPEPRVAPGPAPAAPPS